MQPRGVIHKSDKPTSPYGLSHKLPQTVDQLSNIRGVIQAPNSVQSPSVNRHSTENVHDDNNNDDGDDLNSSSGYDTDETDSYDTIGEQSNHQTDRPTNSMTISNSILKTIVDKSHIYPIYDQDSATVVNMEALSKEPHSVIRARTKLTSGNDTTPQNNNNTNSEIIETLWLESDMSSRDSGESDSESHTSRDESGNPGVPNSWAELPKTAGSASWTSACLAQCFGCKKIRHADKTHFWSNLIGFLLFLLIGTIGSSIVRFFVYVTTGSMVYYVGKVAVSKMFCIGDLIVACVISTGTLIIFLTTKYLFKQWSQRLLLMVYSIQHAMLEHDSSNADPQKRANVGNSHLQHDRVGGETVTPQTPRYCGLNDNHVEKREIAYKGWYNRLNVDYCVQKIDEYDTHVVVTYKRKDI